MTKLGDLQSLWCPPYSKKHKCNTTHIAYVAAFPGHFLFLSLLSLFCSEKSLRKNEKSAGQDHKPWDLQTRTSDRVTSSCAVCRGVCVQVGLSCVQYGWVTACVYIIHETHSQWAWRVPAALNTLTLIYMLSGIINWGCWGTSFTDKLWERVTPKCSWSCSQLVVGRRGPQPCCRDGVCGQAARLSACPRPPQQGMVLHRQLATQSHAIGPTASLRKRLRRCAATHPAVQPSFTPFVRYQTKKCYSGFTEGVGCFELIIQWWKIFWQLEVTFSFHSDYEFLKIFIWRYYIVLDSCL